MSASTTDLILAPSTDADWTAMALLGATAFGEIGHPDSLAAWRTMVPDDAALVASEGGIYGRFGYGPATGKQLMTVDRRFAEFHASVADPPGVRFALQIRDGRARRTPTEAPADVGLDLDVLGSLYLGGYRAEGFATANRLRSNDSALIRRLSAAFATTVPAVLGYGF